MASLGGAAAALFLLGFAPTKGLAVAGLAGFRRLPAHDLPVAPHLRRLDRPGLRPDHGLQLGQQHPARLGRRRHARLRRPLRPRRHRLPVRPDGRR
ncbi:MAG: hypothetical protein MZU79_07470 [Anaerotruncus sp.]|nr:hypothetical protein [Anaerotruncus sp.]